MKSITFKRGSDLRYYTRDYFDTKQDVKTYLDELAVNSMCFNMLLSTQRFTAIVGSVKVVGFTDRYGNKILHIY